MEGPARTAFRAGPLVGSAHLLRLDSLLGRLIFKPGKRRISIAERHRPARGGLPKVIALLGVGSGTSGQSFEITFFVERTPRWPIRRDINRSGVRS